MGIELWGRKNAYNVQKIFWVLQELELEFTHHDVGSLPGQLGTPEFLALNPHARIPVVKDNGVIVWESNTILRYLAARYGTGSLLPEAPLERSYVERWMDWELSKLQPDFIKLFWGYYRTPSESRDQAAIAVAQQQCSNHFDQLDRQLGGQSYLAGKSFTTGDISCAVCLYRYFEMGLKVKQPVHVMHWYRRLSERPAFRNTIMVAFDELQGRLEY